MTQKEFMLRTCMMEYLLKENYETMLKTFQEDYAFCLSFLGRILTLLEEDNFLYLDKKIQENLEHFIDAIIFHYPSDITIREVRRKISQKIHDVEQLTLEEKQQKIKNVLAQQREIYHIPEQISFTKEDLLSLLETDYSHILQIRYLDYDLSNMKLNLFYLLCTINKIIEECPEMLEDRVFKLQIIYLIIEGLRLKKYQQIDEAVMEEYGKGTLQLMDLRSKKEKTNKIIYFKGKR